MKKIYLVLFMIFCFSLVFGPVCAETKREIPNEFFDDSKIEEKGFVCTETIEEDFYCTKKDGKNKVLIAYMGTEKEVTIPASLGITQIGSGAFKGNRVLSSVTIGC